MNHSVKRRRQALHQTHHHYYLNISVEAANLSDCRIESNRKNRFGSENRIESNRNFFCPNWNALLDTSACTQVDARCDKLSKVVNRTSATASTAKRKKKFIWRGGIQPDPPHTPLRFVHPSCWTCMVTHDMAWHLAC